MARPKKYNNGSKVISYRIPLAAEKPIRKIIEDYLDKWSTPIVQNLNKPTNVIQPQEQPKTNYFVNTTPSPLPPRKTPEQWVLEKREIVDQEQYQVWFKALEADVWLTSKQKSIIKSA